MASSVFGKLDWKKIGFGALVMSVGGVLLYLYLHYVWYAGPNIAWKRNGQD